LPPNLPGPARSERKRPVQPPVCATVALPPRRRDGAGQRLGRRRLAVPPRRRPERQALPAAWILGRPELPAARMAERPRRKTVPPRPLHALAAVVSSPEPAGLRRPHARGMRRGPAALQHSPASPGAPERSDLRRGGAG